MMKRFFIILFVMTIILTGCNMDNNKTGLKDTDYKKISAEEANNIIDSEDVIILDVRTPEEYNGGHIENAVLCQ